MHTMKSQVHHTQSFYFMQSLVYLWGVCHAKTMFGVHPTTLGIELMFLTYLKEVAPALGRTSLFEHRPQNTYSGPDFDHP